jgi:hypothetical protein
VPNGGCNENKKGGGKPGKWKTGENFQCWFHSKKVEKISSTDFIEKICRAEFIAKHLKKISSPDFIEKNENNYKNYEKSTKIEFWAEKKKKKLRKEKKTED